MPDPTCAPTACARAVGRRQRGGACSESVGRRSAAVGWVLRCFRGGLRCVIFPLHVDQGDAKLSRNLDEDADPDEHAADREDLQPRVRDPGSGSSIDDVVRFATATSKPSNRLQSSPKVYASVPPTMSSRPSRGSLRSSLPGRRAKCSLERAAHHRAQRARRLIRRSIIPSSRWASARADERRRRVEACEGAR